MKIYHGLDNFPSLSFPIVTIGTFDGVHKGHQEILQRLYELSKTYQGQTVLLTFWPHPRLVLKKNENALKLLSTLEEKIDLLAQNHVEHLVIIPFTEDFSQMTSEAFIQQILVEKIKTKKLIIGYDHHFGKNREGSFEYLKKNAPHYGFDIQEISKQEIDQIAISSTKIRNALVEGNIQIANQYLGNPYQFTGKVVEGDKLGRQLGFPTANLHIAETYKLIPAEGIYAVHVHIEKKMYQGMLYIGRRPTIKDDIQKIEVNIFDFNEDIYGKTLKVSLIAFVREDKKLNNLEELKSHLQKDKEEIIKILQKTVL